MTGGHRDSHKNQIEPQFIVNKSMCRNTNLSQWRSCSHNIAQNCFVGEGPVSGHVGICICVLWLCILLHPSSVIRGKKGGL